MVEEVDGGSESQSFREESDARQCLGCVRRRTLMKARPARESKLKLEESTQVKTRSELDTALDNPGSAG